MKEFFLMTIVTGALAAGAAADMPVKAPVAPVHNWTGFYIFGGVG